MRNLLVILVFLFPFAAYAEERENLPSPEREKLIQNCCVLPLEKNGTSIIGELKPQKHWLRELAKKRRFEVYAVDVRGTDYGMVYGARLPNTKAIGLVYHRGVGVLE